jgi:hypothetical protein
MSRNFGIPSVTRPAASGAQPLPAPHYARGHTHSNSLAGESPSNFAVIRGGSFLSKRELNPVEKLDARLDHREFAVCVFWSVFFTFFVGVPLAIAVGIADGS